MFAQLVSWVKAAVLRAVIAEIQEDFASGGHTIDVPSQLLLGEEKPKPKRGRK